MKFNPRHRFQFIGAFVVAMSLAGFARSDDLPGSTSSVNDLAQSQAPLAQAPQPPGNSQAPATQGKKAEIAPVAPSPDTAQSTPPPPDYRSEANREESATSFASTYAPNVIGDMGGGGPLFTVTAPRGTSFEGFKQFQVPSPSSSILGAQRLSDNDCTLPTDRVFGDYSYFHNAELTSPIDANRFVPGFEKTFLDGRMSVEMRFPMGVLESNDIVVNGPSLGTEGQFGDIQVIVKALLVEQETWALGMGMGVSVPTAPDLKITTAAGTPLVTIANQATHLLPYVGLLVKPNDNWFAQVFVQVDIATNGNPVSTNPFGNGLSSVGNIYDQTLIFADAQIGRWLYRNPNQRFSGLAAVVEAHYTGGLNAPSTLSTNVFSIGYDTAAYNVLDLTIGAHAVVGQTTVTLGFATPVTDDRGFDGELRLFVNRRF